MALPYNPQSVPVGPKTATVTFNSVSYVVDSYSFDSKAEEGERSDSEGTLTGVWLHSARTSGSMTLQLAAATTAVPAIGQTSTYDFQSGTATAIVVSSCGLPAQKGEDRKVTIQWRQTM